ncbi:hypothetical protein [Methanocella paludicola]|uniref:hypothetical protein n=1 Tax=Methanocella paludicola TaxID=570267 RepID=UPI0010081392|nr:hypothetical protein [Methanocella paludicola]
MMVKRYIAISILLGLMLAILTPGIVAAQTSPGYKGQYCPCPGGKCPCVSAAPGGQCPCPSGMPGGKCPCPTGMAAR